jgi:putative two-component system response regulator
VACAVNARTDSVTTTAGEPTIMLVEDDTEVRELLQDQLSTLGYGTVPARSAEEALELLRQTTPDLLITDVRMSGMNGIDLCAKLKADPQRALIPVVILTAVADLDARVAGLAAGADDFFEKPCNFLELRTRLGVLLRVKSLIDQLERAETVITSLGLTIEARDPYTYGHCARLSRYAVALGCVLGVDEAVSRSLRVGGYLHDLGKIAVSDEVLLKPGRLTPEERRLIETHPAAGADLVRGMQSLESVRPIIRHHHERWDGSGYPDGLAGEAIPVAARIMAVVDVYDALITARPYKPALPPQEARAILRQEADSGFWEPRIVRAFLELLPMLERRT